MAKPSAARGAPWQTVCYPSRFCHAVLQICGGYPRAHPGADGRPAPRARLPSRAGMAKDTEKLIRQPPA